MENALFLRPTPVVARELLGAVLVRRFEDGTRIRVRIVETEAYTEDDPACHAFRGKTRANAAMFGPPGTAYVHINYGIHHCLNVVTQSSGCGEAVLIRAVEPLDSPDAHRDHWAGPGRLTRSLGIRKETFDHAPLDNPESGLYLTAGEPVPSSRTVVATRIGIRKAADRPWRWFDSESRMVSRR